MIEDVKRTDGHAREQLPGSGFRDEMEVVANLRVPLAIVHGAEEQLVSADYLKALQAPTLWRGEVQTVADAGHIPQWEQPEQFDALLGAFLDDTSRNA